MSEGIWPGSRWCKFDFHTHTPVSHDTNAWQQAKGTADEVTFEKWLLQYMAAEIDCVAITDHNSADWIDGLKAANERIAVAKPQGYRPLWLFPGVEISVNGGVHVLAVFDPSTPGSTIDSLLGTVDFPVRLHGRTDGQDAAACTGKSFKDVIAAVKNCGGLVIPAHADQDKGLLQHVNTDALKHALELGIDAIEIIDRTSQKPQIYIEKAPCWAEIVGSDCHSFQGDAVPGSRFTWVKMAEPTLEGLRLALHDGNDVSIHRHDDPDIVSFDPDKTPDQWVQQIQIDGMQVMGNGQPMNLAFNPFFNALIGGRGTGKSTIVHALRLVFRRDDELKALTASSAVRQTFDRFAKVPRARNDRGGGGLRSNSAIQVIVWREGIWFMLTWRQDGSGVSVQELEGSAWKPSTSQSIDPQRFKIRIFSQGQIADLAGENQQALLELIDAAAEVRPLTEQWQEAIRSYLTQQAKIRELDGRLAKREGVQLNLDDIARKLAKLEGSDHAAILRSFQHSRQQDHEITHAFKGADDLKGEVTALAPRLVLDDARSGVFDEQADADALRVLGELRAAVAVAQAAVRTAGEELAQQAVRLSRHPDLEAWRRRSLAARQDYEELQAELATQGITDPGVYGQFVQQRQALNTQLQYLDALAGERAALAIKAEQQLQAIGEARDRITRARAAFLADSLSDNPYVRISVDAGGEAIAAAERRLRELMDVTDDRFAKEIYLPDPNDPTAGPVGLLAEWELAADRREAEQAVREALIQAAQGQSVVGGSLRNNLKGRAEKDPAFVDRLRCLSFEDGLRVAVSRRGDGRDFQPIQQASAGQRAAAMLAFLLSYGDEPLVLDQPEDDLDNHMIYSLIVRQIRANKLRRQLIVVTHNPNIVVNGDAELVQAFDFKGGQCVVTVSGALQDAAVREEVCHVMEGGQEAFRRRWQRLGEER